MDKENKEKPLCIVENGGFEPDSDKKAMSNVSIDTVADEKAMVNVSIDNIFPAMGGLGAYQITEFCILLVGCFLCAEAIYGNFTGFTPEHWCSVLELQHLPYDVQQDVSIPKTEEGTFSSCEVYPLNYSLYNEKDFLNWDRDVMFNGTSSISCSAWTYNKSVFISTMVTEWDLVCGDKWKVDFVSSMLMLGVLLGSIFCGMISDRFGRKSSLMTMVVVKILGAGVTLFAPNYGVLIIGKILAGAGFIGVYINTFVIVLELVEGKHRTLLGQIIAAFFSFALTSVSVYAYFIRDLDKLHIVMAAPNLLLLTYAWLIPESPRWLLSQGRKSEAETIIKRIAIINNKPLPDTFCFADITETEEESGANFLDLFRTPKLRLYSIIQFFIWFTANLLYYALTLNSGRLAGDVFLNTALLTLVEVPVNLVILFTMNSPYFMRNRTILISLLVGGIACLICVPLVLTVGESTLTTVMSIIGKAGSTAAFNGMFIYTSEIYPTEVRSVGLGACSMFARFSGLIAPYAGGSLGDVWLPLPSLLFGVFGTVAGVLVLGLPETFGRPLLQTIDDVENMTQTKVNGRKISIDAESITSETSQTSGYGSITSTARL